MHAYSDHFHSFSTCSLVSNDTVIHNGFHLSCYQYITPKFAMDSPINMEANKPVNMFII